MINEFTIEYKKELKDLKIKLKTEKCIYKERKKIIKNKYQEIKRKNSNIVDPPKRCILEEIGNAITHGLGTLFSIVALILMLIKSENIIERVSAILYFVGLFKLFTMSCLYHSFKHGTCVKRIFRRFDYLSIYLLIGSTFVPLLLIFIGGTIGVIFSIIQWCIIIVGITFVGVFGPHKFKKMHMILYIVLGWSGLIFLPAMINNNIVLFYTILGGGIIYSLGIISFALKKKSPHFIWHFFVLAGAIVQWFGIYLVLYK